MRTRVHVLLGVLLTAELAVGCYWSHPRPGPSAPDQDQRAPETDAGAPCVPLAWGDTALLFSPTDTRPVVHDPTHALAAFPGGFAVFWIADAGDLGIHGRFIDLSGRPVGGEIAVWSGETPEEYPEELVAGSWGDAIVVTWHERGGVLRQRFIGFDGRPRGAAVLRRSTTLRPNGLVRNRTLRLELVPRAGTPGYLRYEYFAVFDPSRQFLLYRLGPDGGPEAEAALTMPYASGLEVIDWRGDALVTWVRQASRMPAELRWGTVPWDAVLENLPADLSRELSEGRPRGSPVAALGALYTELATADRSVLQRLDAPAPSIPLTEGRTRNAEVVPASGGDLVLVGELEGTAATMPRVVARELTPQGAEEPVVVAGEECDAIEAHRVEVGAEGHVAVSWVDRCGPRRVRVRLRSAGGCE